MKVIEFIVYIGGRLNLQICKIMCTDDEIFTLRAGEHGGFRLVLLDVKIRHSPGALGCGQHAYHVFLGR
jgi:hypothetical protein